MNRDEDIIPNDKVVRRPRLHEIAPVTLKVSSPRHPSRLLSAPLILLYGFVLLIMVGAGLLWLPISSNMGEHTSLQNAFFTATSAVTVTGLTVVPTSYHWSTFGQAVIFALVLIGGLGFMCFGTFLLILIGQRITLPERMLIRDTVGGEHLGGLVKLLRNIVVVVLAIYGIGMLLIFWHMAQFFPLGEALWQSAFLTVSGFNNAGFSILPGSSSLEAIRSSVWILSILLVLIILGGIGWAVIVDVYKRKRFSRFSLDTKLVIVISLFLWLLGTLVVFALEYANPDTMQSFSVHKKGFFSLFESISGRTAGFTSINFTAVNDPTKVLFIGLMFIGGGAGSTAGGIKVATFAVLMAAVVSSIRGRLQVEAFGREIPYFQVHRALTVTMLGATMIFVVSLILTLTESGSDFSFLDLLFETVSAFGTCGLSMGVASKLTIWGKIMLTVVMVIGRLGPLGLALALIPREESTDYRFAKERVRIG